MANKITLKSVQEIHKCECGCVMVDHAEYSIKHKDLPSAGIRRKIDKATGKIFLRRSLQYSECENCNP